MAIIAVIIVELAERQYVIYVQEFVGLFHRADRKPM